ncbi:release factor glutamine methyltransferase [Jatrophihabitans sp. GAS493]|uniref:putative protein N(5)-glutamine methyltransferase n=1 Tax=Jatrophihabitans sp. GAS493 TaxID=1907575 RepID=UPI000BB6E818|nr:putative protein N(5)-glutamine methyltransferase [Jatrophihabitans sp. GAS493]SOD73946.1 release factor glutamine methyltransferase [Jatrophihabitans sp. GAS493]
MPEQDDLRADVVGRLRQAGCVFAEEEAELLLAAADSPARLEAQLALRVSGQPLEHVLGWAEFYGLRIAISSGVFVPRRRTELLVAEAVAVAGQTAAPIVVDLCCGAGAVAAAIVSAIPTARVFASDLSPEAVSCARRNLVGGGVEVFLGDLYDPLPAELYRRVDVLVANAPYVPTEAIALMPPEARLYERRMALDGGDDGLEIARRILFSAQAWLAEGGTLLIETSDRQAEPLARAFTESGLKARIVESAELDATVVIGALPPDLTGDRLA